MSDDIPEPSTENVSGLEEILPESLMPLYRRYELLGEARATHGPTGVKGIEAIIAAILIGGYVYWLYLFFIVG